jgi:cytoskeleton protein RodZ
MRSDLHKDGPKQASDAALNPGQQEEGSASAGAAQEAGPGRRLREARLGARLPLEEVAARLHLDSMTLRYLEEDDYARLPAPTFVCGYLSGYARLLNLPPGPLLEAFKRRGLTPPKLVPAIASPPRQVHSTDLAVRLATYLIVAGLVVLVVIWWQNQQGKVLSTPEEITHGEVREDTLQSGSHSTHPPVAPKDADHPEMPAPPNNVSPPPGTGSVPPQVAERGVPPLAVPVPSAGAEARTTEVASHAPETSSPMEQPPPAQTAPNPQETAERQVQDLLVLRFRHDSWVGIYDRDKKRLYYGSAEAGKTLELRGNGPLKVVLGHAKEVEVEYNGKLFDYTPFIRGGVAKFSVGTRE